MVVPILGFSGYYLFSSVRNYYAVEAEEHSHQTGNRSKRHFFPKVYSEGDKQFLWALGSKNPKDESHKAFDMTGTPLSLERVQYGIGRDTIASIDHPVFVDPDDPRLRLLWGHSETQDVDFLPVIGYEHNGVARAYPVRLLDHHELVNDTVGGKPVTVGW